MPDLNIGGQAVIEGVMMRSKDKIATAVRVPSGEILVKTEDYKSLAARKKIFNIPFVRGAIAFFEMMIIGIKTLNFSADIAMQEVEKEEALKKGEEYQAKEKKSNAIMLGFSVIFALAAGVGIFFLTPLLISSLFGISKEAVIFNLVAGTIRLTMFVGYVWIISMFGEFRRIFQYHGAEHKSIYAYEMGDELTPDRASYHTRLHPRCGTSFILIVALLAVLIYAIADTIYQIYVGPYPNVWMRFGVHFVLLPLIAGSSYELLKLSGKTRHNALTKFLIQPGLWLQLITTKEPSKEQLEVAIMALKASLGEVPANIPADKTPA